MSKKRNLIFLCLLILGVFLITGCFLKPPATVTFNSQGGSAVNSQTVEHGGLATEPTAPTKEGCTFGGWYKELECINAWDFATDAVTSDVTLYAKWTINFYTVAYNGNGNTAGTVPVGPSSPYEYGATVTVLGNTGGLTRINDGGTSYRFTGWNTKADGSGSDQAEGSTFTMGASNVTLYAQWTPYVLRDTGPAGGYIFYDKGSYFNGWRYLEAAPASTERIDKQWGSYGTFIGGIETGIGTGQSNTTIIVTWLNNNSDDTYGDVTYKTDRAAYLCDALTMGLYSDWFLPSRDELNLMYENLHLFGVSGFADYDYYWSSSEPNASTAWVQAFSDGHQGGRGKSNGERVRAVRAF